MDTVLSNTDGNTHSASFVLAEGYTAEHKKELYAIFTSHKAKI